MSTLQIQPKIIHPGFSRSIIPVPYSVPGSTIHIDENTVCCENSDACVVRLALATSYKDIRITDFPAMIRASHSLSFCILCIRHQAHFDPTALDGLYQDDPVIRNPDDPSPFLPIILPQLHMPCIHIEQIQGTTIHPRRVVAQIVKTALDSKSNSPYYTLALFVECKNTFMVFSKLELDRIGQQ